MPEINELVALVEQVDRCGYDSLWVGDHIPFAIPILDPLQQLAQAAVVSRQLLLGTSVYLLPLRPPGPVAKQVATLDHLTEGRLIFGVGGEFPLEYALAGVPIGELGARLSETIPVLRKLWTGEPVAHEGRFYAFPDVRMQPPTRQLGGPPIWCGGRSEAALKRTGRLADGEMCYEVTPEMYRTAGRRSARRRMLRAASSPGSAPAICSSRLDDTYEKALDAATETLSVRYAMDFRKAAARYCALDPPAQMAERIRDFSVAGVRHVVLDLLGPYEERHAQIERVAAEVLPLLKDLTAVERGTGARDASSRFVPPQS